MEEARQLAALGFDNEDSFDLFLLGTARLMSRLEELHIRAQSRILRCERLRQPVKSQRAGLFASYYRLRPTEKRLLFGTGVMPRRLGRRSRQKRAGPSQPLVP